MNNTVIPAGDPKAIRRYSALLAAETLGKMYFHKKFMGEGENYVIQLLGDLESDAGDKIQFDLSVQLRNAPVKGDNKAKGREEGLRFYTDQVEIDQIRHPVDLGGRMTRKRTLHNLRNVAKRRQSEYWASYMDQEIFMYLAAARGINEDFIEGTDYEGRANNAFEAPDSQHILYGGDATGKADLVAADKMTRSVIERASVKAEMMRSLDPESANMVPVNIEGGEHYCVVMSPFQEHDMRTDAGAGNWLDIQKAAAAAEGRKNKIFTGALGMINDVVLHKHRHVIRFDDYGAGANVPAARALMMGRQAAVMANGLPENLRFAWEEEPTDFNNAVAICSGTICGIKKSRFNSRDFGVISIDTAATDPNA